VAGTPWPVGGQWPLAKVSAINSVTITGWLAACRDITDLTGAACCRSFYQITIVLAYKLRRNMSDVISDVKI